MRKKPEWQFYLIHFSAIYKSHIDNSDLYSRDDGSGNPVAGEMQHKLNMESERLRARLRQELTELQERLSPSSSHISATLASMRERLAPITQQLQSALSSNAKDLCSQLRLYLQSLEQTGVQPEASPAIYGEASHWMSQTLERGNSRLANSITDFNTRATAAVQHLRELDTEEEEAEQELWQEIGQRLEREVSSLRADAQSHVAALEAEIAALLETARPSGTDVAASLERFCQNAALQSQVFGARMESLIQGLREELQVRGGSSVSSFSSSSSSSKPDSSLPEDFTVQLSALIQDIMHSVSWQPEQAN